MTEREPHWKPGMTAGHSGEMQVQVVTVDEYLVDKVTALLLNEYDQRDMVTEPSGRVRKRTNWEKGERRGRIDAYLDAILAVRAGSSYFPNDRQRLESQIISNALKARDRAQEPG